MSQNFKNVTKINRVLKRSSCMFQDQLAVHVCSHTQSNSTENTETKVTTFNQRGWRRSRGNMKNYQKASHKSAPIRVQSSAARGDVHSFWGVMTSVIHVFAPWVNRVLVNMKLNDHKATKEPFWFLKTSLELWFVSRWNWLLTIFIILKAVSTHLYSRECVFYVKKYKQQLLKMKL